MVIFLDLVKINADRPARAEITLEDVSKLEDVSRSENIAKRKEASNGQEDHHYSDRNAVDYSFDNDAYHNNPAPPILDFVSIVNDYSQVPGNPRAERYIEIWEYRINSESLDLLAVSGIFSLPDFYTGGRNFITTYVDTEAIPKQDGSLLELKGVGASLLEPNEALTLNLSTYEANGNTVLVGEYATPDGVYVIKSSENSPERVFVMRRAPDRGHTHHHHNHDHNHNHNHDHDH
ncbi:MAG: hypothetical protein AAFZ92_05200 [Pseudomonadota bacterium]